MDDEICAQCSDFMRCYIEGRGPSENGICMENCRDDDECDEMTDDEFCEMTEEELCEEEMEAADGQGQ